MIVDQLKAFYAVVKYGGFDRAAESIKLSQPGVSMRIKRLEKDLGVDLFSRLGGRARLTDAGKIVHEHAGRLMIVLDEMRQAIDELKGLQRGQLRCGATPTYAVHLLPKVLVQFKRYFPNVEIRLIGGKTSEIAKRILAQDIDIGLVTATPTIPDSLRTFHLLTDEFVFVTARNHPLAKLHKISLKQIGDVPLILREKGSLQRMIIDECFRRSGLAYRCIMEMEAAEALKRAVTEGLGCSIVSFCSIQTETQIGTLAYARIVKAPMKRTFIAIMHRGKTLSGPMKPFLELLKLHINSASS